MVQENEKNENAPDAAVECGDDETWLVVKGFRSQVRKVAPSVRVG